MDDDLLLDAIVFFALILGLPFLAVRAFHFVRDNFLSK